MDSAATPPLSHRIDSIDLLRGLVIILMALDHARDLFSLTPYAPEDLSQASTALFFTRWVTHFCAPVFLFLAGLGAWLYQSRGRSRREVSAFLLKRGLFLILLELTIINLSWLSAFFGGFIFIQVIWVIGVSMVVLAGLLWLPRELILVLALAMIAGHNLFDRIQPADLGSLEHLWGVLHARYWIPLGKSFGLLVIYPLIPWPAVMALGYVVGPWFQLESGARRRRLVVAGLVATALFVALRWVNVYGDASPWLGQENGLRTFVSFLNTTKYPPSLLFLLMTLGPSLVLLALLERARGRLATWVLAFGRVPLFFYVVHLPLLHAAAILFWQIRLGAFGWWARPTSTWPEEYDPNLLLGYVAWAVVTVALYWACRWYGGFKARSDSPIWSYL